MSSNNPWDLRNAFAGGLGGLLGSRDHSYPMTVAYQNMMRAQAQHTHQAYDTQMYGQGFRIPPEVPKEVPLMVIDTEQVDGHCLLKVGEVRRIAHNKKELREMCIEFVDAYLDTLWVGAMGDKPSEEDTAKAMLEVSENAAARLTEKEVK